MRGDSSMIVRSVVSPHDSSEQVIASATENGTILLWNLQGKLLKSWKVQSSENQPSQRIWNVSFSPDGK